MKLLTSLGAVLIGIILISACSKDQKTSAERDKEVQRVLQEGAQKEQKMYEGMQKNVENMEKKTQEQKEEKKK
jgi:Skp family chaperone for outer membrane proteins